MASNAYNLGARDPLKKPGSWDKAFKRKAGIEKATDKLTKEEAENLDELSKKTLGSYIKRSAAERGHAGIEAGAGGQSGSKDQKDAMRTMKKRLKGITMASDRLTKEEANLDEVSSTTIMNYSIKAAQQGMKRVAGQKTADEKMRKKDGYSSTAKVAAGPARPKKDKNFPLKPKKWKFFSKMKCLKRTKS